MWPMRPGPPQRTYSSWMMICWASGRLRPRQQIFLFGEAGASLKSAVLIPLYEAREIGVLALGSENEARFYPGMGTLFIGQLGGLVARALARYLEPPLHSSVEMGS